MSDAGEIGSADVPLAGAAGDAQAQYELGVRLLAGGAAEDLPRAVEALAAAARQAPDRAECRAAHGCALERAGEVVPGAVNALYAATRIAPDDPLYAAYHATLLAGAAPPDVAQATVERACKRQGIDLGAIRAELKASGAEPTPAALAERAFGDVRAKLLERLSAGR